PDRSGTGNTPAGREGVTPVGSPGPEQDLSGDLPRLVGYLGPRRPVGGRPEPLEGVDADVAVEDHGLSNEPSQEPQVRDQAEDDGLVERDPESFECLGPIGA